jgi:hypothetical protein
MSVVVLVALVGTPLLLAAVVVPALSSGTAPVQARREWTLVRATWGAAAVVGAVVAWLLDRSLDLGRGTMLVPAVLGVFVVAGVGLGETVVRPPRPSGPRSASLSARRVGDYLPRAVATTVGLVTVLHLGTLALTTSTASADDLGRAGRQVAAACGSVASAAGPYPGRFYAAPLAVLLLVTGLAAVAALTAVARRPRGFAPDDVGDDVLRRRSATRVLAAGGAAVSASHVGIAFFAGTALLRLSCHDAWMRPVGWALVASVPVALGLLGWFVGRVVAPGGLAPASPARPVTTP